MKVVLAPRAASKLLTMVRRGAIYLGEVFVLCGYSGPFGRLRAGFFRYMNLNQSGRDESRPYKDMHCIWLHGYVPPARCFYTDEYPRFSDYTRRSGQSGCAKDPVFLAAQASLNVSCERSA